MDGLDTMNAITVSAVLCCTSVSMKKATVTLEFKMTLSGAAVLSAAEWVVKVYSAYRTVGDQSVLSLFTQRQG